MILPCVFVNDIGGQFRIRIGARDFFECVTATQIWGPCDNEKGNHLVFDNEKGSHLWHISTSLCSNGVAQTVPESFLPPTVPRLSPVLLPVQRLPPPATAFPTPGAGCCVKATPSQGRARWVGSSGAGALVLALTGVAHLSSRTGGSYPLLDAGTADAIAGSATSTWCPARSACCSR